MSSKLNRNYLDHYLESVENLPYELQRNFSYWQEMDSRIQSKICSIDRSLGKLEQPVRNEEEARERVDLIQKLKAKLEACLECGIEKTKLATASYDMVETRVRRLDDDRTLCSQPPAKEQKEYQDSYQENSYSSSNSRHSGNNSSNSKSSNSKSNKDNTEKESSSSSKSKNNNKEEEPTPTRKVKRKADKKSEEGHKNKRSQKKSVAKGRETKASNKRKVNVEPEPEEEEEEYDEEDEEEERYCICQEISHGEMIACDNEKCETEWFHFKCVDLSSKPKGKWFCPNCRKK